MFWLKRYASSFVIIPVALAAALMIGPRLDVTPAAQTVVLNPSGNLAGKTILAAENSNTVTGNLTFSRGAGVPPFTIAAGAGPVLNLLINNIVTTAVTGTQNNFAPGLAGQTTVRMTNATLTTITGLAGGTDAQVVTFYAAGAGTVTFTHQDPASIAGNRFTNMATSPPPSGTSIASGGHATYQYSTAAGVWYLIDHEQGAWITQPFNAADFSGGAMTWTVASGNVSQNQYYLSGKQLFWALSENGGTVGGTLGSILSIAVPGSYLTTGGGAKFVGPNQNTDGGPNAYSNTYASNSTLQRVDLIKLSSANWSAGALSMTFNVVLATQ